MTATRLTIVKTPDSGNTTRVEGWEGAELAPERVWKAVLGVVRAVIAGDDERELLKISVGGQVVTTDTAAMPAPDGTDGPEAWLASIQGMHPAGTPVYLYARELAAHDRDMFEVLLSTFGVVFEQHGLVRGNIDIEAFVGDYKATPGGIHREQCGNSHFVLLGRKYMHFWHGEDWIPASVDRQKAAGMTAIDPEEYLPSLLVSTVVDRGTSLMAAAGEFFTWDPGTWHVGETIGPAFAVNIARYTKSFVAGEGTYPYPSSSNGRVASEWLEGYRAFLGPGFDAQSALARASAYGLDGPEPQYTSADDLSRVLVRNHAPRLWYQSQDDVLVATHGKCRRFPRTVLPWLVAVAELPPGTACTTPSEADTLDLVRFLQKNGAVAAA